MKRRFRLGPATTFALAGALVVAYVRFPAWQREAEQTRQLDATRARVKRQSVSKTPLRTLQTVWDERAALHLSPPQLQALGRLRVEEARQTAPLQQRAERAAQLFQTWIKAHRGGASPSDIQQQSALYSAASAQWSQERGRFRSRALALLSPAQRAQVAAHTQLQP